MSLIYRLFHIPRTSEEFIRKAALDRQSTVISYETRQKIETTGGPNALPFLSYQINLLLYSTPPMKENTKDELKAKFTLELKNETKTQFSQDSDPLIQEALSTVHVKLPEIIELCNKYRVKYHIDEKTNSLLASHPG